MKLQLSLAIAMMAIALLTASAGAYTTHIRAPAVLFGQDAGVLTSVSLNLTQGNGTVAVKGPQIVNDSTLQSAQTAAAYAASYAGVNERGYNFIYTIFNASNVSGPSGGLALTLLAIAALQKKELPMNFTATGTISPSGAVGTIGGVYDKVQAAKAGRLSFIFVPYAPNGSFEQELYYMTQQQFNVTVIEVANASQAVNYLFSGATLPAVTYNVSANYYQSSLPAAGIACQNCSIGSFAQLTNFTFSSTDGVIAGLGPQYSSLKAQMNGLETSYKQIAQKGYLYSGSDLSFLLYGNAYALLNSNNITVLSANSLVANVSSYCSSLVPPPMTNTNYEYVIGGELRQSWGSVYSGIAQQQINASQTSDELVSAMTDAGRASGWCKAASEMYSIAASLGGQYVQPPPSIKANAATALNTASGYGSSTLYYQSAMQNYKEGNYAASLYASGYATAFYGFNPSSNAIAASNLMSNLSSYNYGAWPTEFALQAQFYEQEARLAGNQSENASAFYVANLARILSNDNRQLYASFEYNVTQPIESGSNTALAHQVSNLTAQAGQLQRQLQNAYYLIFAVLIMLFAVFVLLLVSLLGRHPEHEYRPRRHRR